MTRETDAQSLATSADAELKLAAGQRVLVAGASSGIGRELLRLLMSSDVLVGAHYFQNQRELEAAVESEASSGAARVKLFQADLRTAAASRTLMESFVDWAGGIDVLVQLTGGLERAVPWHDLSEAEWQHDLALNLTAPFFLAQSAMRQMRRGGRIVLTSTASARHGGGPDSMAYGVAKAGIEFLTKGLARAGAPDGILVNAVCPGLIDTGFHTRHLQRTPEQLRRRTDLVPLKRAGTPREVAAVILFLASPLNSYITGEAIAVSGGDWL